MGDPSKRPPIDRGEFARLVKDFDIKVYKRRDGNDTVNAYDWGPITTALARNAPDQSGTAEQPKETKGSEPVGSGTGSEPRSASDGANKPENTEPFRRSTSEAGDDAHVNIEDADERF